MRQYRPAERAPAQKSDALLSGRLRARSRREGRRQEIVIADAALRRRKLPGTQSVFGVRRERLAPPTQSVFGVRRERLAPPTQSVFGVRRERLAPPTQSVFGVRNFSSAFKSDTVLRIDRCCDDCIQQSWNTCLNKAGKRLESGDESPHSKVRWSGFDGENCFKCGRRFRRRTTAGNVPARNIFGYGLLLSE